VTTPGDWLETLAAAGVVPVVEIDDAAKAVDLADALGSAGLSVVEVTFRTPSALDAIGRIAVSRPATLVAAGTVLAPDQVEHAIGAGARLLVSPGWSAAVAERAAALGVPFLPGVCTPTEVQTVVAAGFGAAKVFPAQPIGGVPYLRALSAPFPSMRWNPTGGISPETLGGYVALPSVVACGGSWVAPRADIAAARWDAIAARAAEAVAIVRSARPISGA